MTLDDLMAVWRSQDAAPLHGVNETLLRLALRQDEARLHALRRRENWFIYVVSTFLAAGMAVFIVMMFGMLIYNDDDVITGWDVVVPIVGVVAALVMGVALYLTRRAQVRREERFGDSLRDQLGRRIAQLDDAVTRGGRLGWVLLIATCVSGLAMVVSGIRVNLEPDEPFGGWPRILRIILFFALVGLWSARVHRRATVRDLLPRKHRLEALLKELDG
jgi:O-antigen/teichoic acid export membrane protein